MVDVEVAGGSVPAQAPHPVAQPNGAGTAGLVAAVRAATLAEVEAAHTQAVTAAVARAVAGERHLYGCALDAAATTARADERRRVAAHLERHAASAGDPVWAGALREAAGWCRDDDLWAEQR